MVQENRYTRRNGPDDRGPARRNGSKNTLLINGVMITPEKISYRAGACFYGPGPARRAARYPRRVLCLPGGPAFIFNYPARVHSAGPGQDTRRRVCFCWTIAACRLIDNKKPGAAAGLYSCFFVLCCYFIAAVFPLFQQFCTVLFSARNIYR